MSCHHCGTAAGRDLAFCPGCGHLRPWFHGGTATASSPRPAPARGVLGPALGLPPDLPATWAAPPTLAPEPVLAGEHTTSRCYRGIAVLLAVALFTGVGGLHRFYAGKVWTGILQLLTGGGFFIWQFIDVLVIASGSFRDADGRLIRR